MAHAREAALSGAAKMRQGIGMTRRLPAIAMLGTLILASPALAAEQGGLGASSKGEILISVTVASRATMSDIAATPASGASRSACVWIDTATHRYALTMLGGGARWHGSGTSTAGTAIPPGGTLSGLVATAVRPDCDHDATHLAGYDRTGADPATPATLVIAPE